MQKNTEYLLSASAGVSLSQQERWALLLRNLQFGVRKGRWETNEEANTQGEIKVSTMNGKDYRGRATEWASLIAGCLRDDFQHHLD